MVYSRPRLQEEFGGLSKERISSHFYDVAVRANRLSDFPQSPSLQSFAAFLILDATWFREEQPLTCCSFVGVAFRVAQMLGILLHQYSSATYHCLMSDGYLGLHKDPSRFHETSATEIQTRRQLWWNVITIDTQVAFASGLPPLIESGSYDVETVSELTDAFTSNEATDRHRKSILGIFINGKFFFYKKSGELLRLLHSNRLSKEDIDGILTITREIQDDVNARQAQIAAVEQNVDNADQLPGNESAALERTQSNPILRQFTSILLSMFAAKPYAIMYGPIRRHNLLPYLQEKEPK